MDATTETAGQQQPAQANPGRVAAAERHAGCQCEARLAGLLAAMCAVRAGNFRARVPVTGGDVVAEICTVFNEVADHSQHFKDELVRVGDAVARDGLLHERLSQAGGEGGWRASVDAANTLMDDLTRPLVETSRVLAAVADGDLSQRSTVSGQGDIATLAETINSMTATLRVFASEVTRVAREVGTEGRLGGQAQVPGVAGTWKDLTDSVNLMAGNLTAQVRDISSVATGVARGDLSRKITVDVRGEILELKTTINTMVDQLSAFGSEVTRVAREVGSDGRLGGQAQVPGVAGTWKDLTDSVNLMAGNLTAQVRNIAQVATAVAQGDLSQKITVDVRGEILELKTTINTMVDQLSAFADEVTRVAREVGTEGNLGGQARVRGVSGTWKDLTDNVNVMANNLTGQVRSIATVATAVAGGDLSKKITIEAKGEVAALAGTINGMVDTLLAFADEVTRVAREVGTEGQLGGQARVPNVAGTWKDLTDNVNFMANNLTSQVRNIAQVTTAVAQGDLTRKIDVDARGEILELKTTINTMVDQLSAFASEVTRVAREVGTAGILGGQAEVEGVSGTWKKLTESVNQLAGNLTTQVRAIAGVATAVTEGDLTRRITVDASGEVAELKDNINQMIANLGETTRANVLQDWLKTNLARISGLLQGHRDLAAMAGVIMGELAPLVSAQHGAFFLAETADGPVIAGEEAVGARLRQLAAYGYAGDPAADRSFAMGQGLVGQSAVEKRTILVTGAPAGYVKVSSGLGWSESANVIVLPVLFQGQVLGVIELASVNEFSEVHRDFLEQLKEVIGVAVNTITANSRTDSLLQESQRLTGELRSRQQELQASNAELEDKAALLARQNRDIELKTAEIEQARLTLEDRAQQLALASKVKSEFMANMSHELRTPLNSLLILAKLLADNTAANLTPQQVDFARTIHTAGSDLLQLINDILDLAKVEAGRMDISYEPLPLEQLVDYVEATFQPLAAEKGLDFTVDVSPLAPSSITTDEQRVQQVLRNLLSNAVKFTDHGSVTLRVAPAAAAAGPGQMLAFAVSDTGCGIASEKLQIIFEAFQQADGTTSRQYGGTGLGLSISRELTQLLGGELQVASAPDSGSTFTLYLPAHPELGGRTESLGVADVHYQHELPGPDQAPDPARGGETAPSASPAVLIVERPGKRVLRRAAVSALGGIAGVRDRVEIVTEHTAADATCALSRLKLVSVMLDLGLPAADTHAVLDAVTGQARGVPVLIYEPASGHDAGAQLHSAYGARCHLETVSTAARAAERLTFHLLTGIPQRAGLVEEASEDMGAASRFAGEKILVIDDDVRNVFALTSALELHGLSVLYADNGRQGIEMLRQHDDVALVLMDIMMPGMDGYATTARIRGLTRFADLPIIAVTAKAMKGDREKSLAAGTNEHVTKPVDIDRLLAMIQAMLARGPGSQPKRTAVRQVSSSVSDRTRESIRST